MIFRSTLQVFALAIAALALIVLLATPACIWIASVRYCEQMFCEIALMRRPLSDVSYCEAWFDLFR